MSEQKPRVFELQCEGIETYNKLVYYEYYRTKVIVEPYEAPSLPPNKKLLVVEKSAYDSLKAENVELQSIIDALEETATKNNAYDEHQRSLLRAENERLKALVRESILIAEAALGGACLDTYDFIERAKKAVKG